MRLAAFLKPNNVGHILTPCLLELWVLGEGSILSKFASGWVGLWALRLES